MKKPLRLFPALLLLLSAGAAAQSVKEPAPTPAQRAEAARLRGALASAVGESFEVVRERRDGSYWLAYLRAERPGVFLVRYKYRYKDLVRPQDPLYTFVEHETSVVVGPRGCARTRRHNSLCVGDTLILPVVLDGNTEHTFSFESWAYVPVEEATERLWRETEEAGLWREAVPNPAEEFLKYVGRRAQYLPHRAPGYTLEFYATFEAVKPGSFNLLLGLGAPPAGIQASEGSVPIFIVGRGEPLTILSSREHVHGYTERFSSDEGNNYLTTPLVLQPGDRITLLYSSYTRRGRSEGGENREALEASVKDYAPAITMLPFRVNPARDFNRWIVEFLTAAPRPDAPARR